MGAERGSAWLMGAGYSWRFALGETKTPVVRVRYSGPRATVIVAVEIWRGRDIVVSSHGSREMMGSETAEIECVPIPFEYPTFEPGVYDVRVSGIVGNTTVVDSEFVGTLTLEGGVSLEITEVRWV